MAPFQVPQLPFTNQNLQPIFLLQQLAPLLISQLPILLPTAFKPPNYPLPWALPLQIPGRWTMLLLGLSEFVLASAHCADQPACSILGAAWLLPCFRGLQSTSSRYLRSVAPYPSRSIDVQDLPCMFGQLSSYEPQGSNNITKSLGTCNVVTHVSIQEYSQKIGLGEELLRTTFFPICMLTV